MILLLSFLFLLLFSLFSFFLYYRCPMIQLWLVFTELPDRQTQPNNIEDNNELIHVTQITHSTYMISCHIVILVTKQNFWFCEFESLIYMLSVSCPMIIKFNNLSIHCKGFIHVLKTLFTNLWWTHDKSKWRHASNQSTTTRYYLSIYSQSYFCVSNLFLLHSF